MPDRSVQQGGPNLVWECPMRLVAGVVACVVAKVLLLLLSKSVFTQSFPYQFRWRYSQQEAPLHQNVEAQVTPRWLNPSMYHVCMRTDATPQNGLHWENVNRPISLCARTVEHRRDILTNAYKATLLICPSQGVARLASMPQSQAQQSSSTEFTRECLERGACDHHLKASPETCTTKFTRISEYGQGPIRPLTHRHFDDTGQGQTCKRGITPFSDRTRTKSHATLCFGERHRCDLDTPRTYEPLP